MSLKKHRENKKFKTCAVVKLSLVINNHILKFLLKEFGLLQAIAMFEQSLLAEMMLKSDYCFAFLHFFLLKSNKFMITIRCH